MREEELFAAYGSPRRVAIPDERFLEVDREHPVDEGRTTFYRYVVQTAGCWLWRGPKTQGGYGIWVNPQGRRMLAHRAAWRFVHGPIPDGEQVRHVRPCTSRACVRPDHLALGVWEPRSGPGRLSLGATRERAFRERLREAVRLSIRPDLSTPHPQPATLEPATYPRNHLRYEDE